VSDLEPLSAPPRPLDDRIAVVVNGNAKSVTAEVIETLDQILDSGDLFVSRHVEESEGIARTLVDRGYGTILTGGGDGTFTVVVTAVVKEARKRKRSAAPLRLVPARHGQLAGVGGRRQRGREGGARARGGPPAPARGRRQPLSSASSRRRACTPRSAGSASMRRPSATTTR
jgi:hypothetical protein